jgi:hypothetical protein
MGTAATNTAMEYETDNDASSDDRIGADATGDEDTTMEFNEADEAKASDEDEVATLGPDDFEECNDKTDISEDNDESAEVSSLAQPIATAAKSTKNGTRTAKESTTTGKTPRQGLRPNGSASRTELAVNSNSAKTFDTASEPLDETVPPTATTTNDTLDRPGLRTNGNATANPTPTPTLDDSARPELRSIGAFNSNSAAEASNNQPSDHHDNGTNLSEFMKHKLDKARSNMRQYKEALDTANASLAASRTNKIKQRQQSRAGVTQLKPSQIIHEDQGTDGFTEVTSKTRNKKDTPTNNHAPFAGVRLWKVSDSDKATVQFHEWKKLAASF